MTPTSGVRGCLRPLHLVLLFTFVFGVYLLTGDYYWQNVDTASTLLASWRLATEQTFTMDDFAGRGYWVVLADGRWVSGRFPGAILLGVPFYVLSDGQAALPSAVPSVVAAAGTSALAVTLLCVLLCRLVTPRVAVGASLLAALGTATWSVSAAALWTHAPAQVALVAAMLFASKERHLFTGLAFGAALLARPHLAVIALVWLVALSTRDRGLRSCLKLAAGTSVGLLILLLWNRTAFDEWTISGGYAGLDATMGSGVGPIPFVFNIAATLVSPARGLLVLCPFLLCLLPGARQAWRVAPLWVQSFAVGGLIYLIPQLWLATYSGGFGFYGNRIVLEPLTVICPLLVLAFREWTVKTEPRRVTFWVFAACAVATHGVGASLYSGRNQDPDALTKLPVLSLFHQKGLLVIAVGAALFVCTLLLGWRSGRQTQASAPPQQSELSLASNQSRQQA